MKLLGQRLMARDFDRQVAEVQVRIAVLNGYTALGIPQSARSQFGRPPVENTLPPKPGRRGAHVDQVFWRFAIFTTGTAPSDAASEVKRASATSP